MEQRIKHLIVSACTFVFLGHIHFAFGDTVSDTETLLNWAEVTFPELFPSHQATQNIEPWLFRHYPASGVYAGVNQGDNGVYVLGGALGDTATRIDDLSSLVSQITNSGGGGNTTACDTTSVIAGITYSQSGDVVSVTSNGQCVSVPDLTNNSNFCPIPQQTTASGISLLSSNTVTSSKMEGLTIPGFSSTIQDIVTATANVQHCTINATAEAADLIVNSDLCFDITSALSTLLADFPVEGIEVTPPVNYSFLGTYTSQIVTDCFATEAATISDAFTGESWIKQNGSFVKVAN